MGGEEKPVFHDFLGMKIYSGTTEHHAPSRASALEEEIDTSSAGSRLLSGPMALLLPSSSDPERLSCGKWERLETHGSRIAFDNRTLGKKRDSSTPIPSIGDCSQEILESSRGIKLSRFDSKDERRGMSYDDEVRMGMQPPRPSPSCQSLIHQAMSLKPDIMASRNWERQVPINTGAPVYSPSRLTNLGGYNEKSSANVVRENLLAPTMLPRPPADEGSRTGLKGSGIGNLVNSAQNATTSRNGSGQGVPAGRSKYLVETSVPQLGNQLSHQGATSASRQLTIFYAGQAHVFDDVQPSKADAIMALAGSNGRSWSTSYLPRPRSNFASAVAESHIPSAGREKVGSRMSNANGSSDFAVLPEFQSLLPAIARGGNGVGQLDRSFVQFASENMQAAIGGNGRKDGPVVPCPSICSNEGDKETLCHSQQLA